MLNVIPMIIARAILLAFEDKMKEDISDLIACSDGYTNKTLKDMEAYRRQFENDPTDLKDG